MTPLDQIGAVTRALQDTERDGRPARALVATQTYDAPLDDVWDAVTSPERLPRWFLPVSGDLVVGGRYQLEGNAGGTVLACDPPRALSVTWEYGGEVTWVDVTLSDAAGSTTLELRHTAVVDERWGEYGPGAVGIGWDMALRGLAVHLATGEALDAAEAMAWSVSDEGREFVTRSGDRWYDADVAGGADPSSARAAADRTIAAYTAVPEG
ncbi:MAG: SRPBCC family protein [Nocardioidaceae bacterium]|nr:SRPBCC family protein [Nocardioidaceae bacterium]NUS52412.1 SRPBCC family protein [Nocardioidaceae bacterium]